MSATPAAPILETERLRLRGWKPDDADAYAAMLADSGTARFITREGKPYNRSQAWAEMAFLTGHWQLLGFGMFVVEELSTGRFLGRVGPLQPPGWPDFEVAWALNAVSCGMGYATEAAEKAIEWSFHTLGVPRIISVIHPNNTASQAVAARVGEHRTAETFAPFGEACDIWQITRQEWLEAREGS